MKDVVYVPSQVPRMMAVFSAAARMVCHRLPVARQAS